MKEGAIYVFVFLCLIVNSQAQVKTICKSEKKLVFIDLVHDLQLLCHGGPEFYEKAQSILDFN